MHQLLTDEERARLAVMSSIVRFKKGEVIYQEGDPADAVFNINTGVVTAYRKAPDGGESMVAFLLPGDLFGLSAEGRYTNSIKAITAVTAYRLPIRALRSRLPKDAELESRYLQALPGTAASSATHLFTEPEKSFY